jgi:hypothetical protein
MLTCAFSSACADLKVLSSVTNASLYFESVSTPHDVQHTHASYTKVTSVWIISYIDDILDDIVFYSASRTGYF